MTTKEQKKNTKKVLICILNNKENEEGNYTN